jgi:dynein heavy chain, axonemal
LKVSFETARGIKANLLTSVIRVPDSLVMNPDSTPSV